MNISLHVYFIPKRILNIINMRIKQLVYTLSLGGILITSSCNQQTETHVNSDYKLLRIEPSEIRLNNPYSAAIRGKQDIRIIPRVDGYLTEVRITEGSKVRKNEILFVIDQAPFISVLQGAKANVSLCEANVSTAQLNYESKKNLFDKNIVSNFDLQTATNALKTANAQLELAKSQVKTAENNLSYTVIKSPSDGVVGKLPYRIGDFVSPAIQDGLTVVADNSEMYVYFSMTENQILDLLNKYENIDDALNKLPEVELQMSNQTIYDQKGKIESISGVIDPSTGSVSLRAVFSNQSKKLLSGGTGSVIMPYEHSNVFVIPQEATFEIQNKVYVYKIVNGEAKSSIIEIDKINDGRAFIVHKGLEQGDVIIAEGAGLVQEGTKVNNSLVKE